MKNIELVAIPFLMLSDYFLTILGRIYWRRKFGEHFTIETYELNPVWRKDVDSNKWINFRHLAGVVIVTVLFYFLSTFEETYIYNWLLGYFLTLFGMVNGRHLSNIFIFKYLIYHPNEVSGKVNQSHIVMLKLSQYQTIILLLPLLILVLLESNAFLLGGSTSCIGLMIYHSIWIRKYKRSLI